MDNPTYLEPLNKEAASKLAVDMDALLEQINVHQIKLSKSYARLGGLLREVKLQQYWISYGYDRFSTYLEFIQKRIGRERSQVYSFLQVAEALLPLLTEGQLEDVGITKAHELRRFVEQGGSLQTEGIMDYASDPRVTAKQLRVRVNELLHIHEESQGNWIDIGGFYATVDERKEIDQFWTFGRNVLQLGTEVPEHTWKHEVFMAAVRECVSSWAEEANAQ